jgi:hypothetical protein
MQRGGDVFPRALKEVEGTRRGEADRVQHTVQVIDMLGEPLGQRVEMLLVGHVQLDHRRGRRQPLGDGLGDLHGAPE